jgi:glycosyltransferase involved in cell wall biosynthesis
MIRDFRIIIFYRCPWTKEVDLAIKLAKKLNKKVFFDVDDLVIDKKYTNLIPYLKTLTPKEKNLYDDGVERMKKTLLLCEGAITTTRTLAKELKHYVSNVYINRNVASEEMWKLSNDALETKNTYKKGDNIIIGYFSGSITHNSDIDMIKSALIRILREFKNVKILLFGELSFPIFLNEFSSQIITKKFTDWKKLPKVISSVDINIAPIEQTIFNEAKSENKWVEAALVKVPTVSSNYGEFKNVIIHNETGLLCSNINDWYDSLKTLIINEKLRKTIGENAYKICKKKYNTIYTGRKFANYINSISNKHIGFFIPSLQIAGGIYVILKHACYLKDEGWDVDIIVPETDKNFYEFQGHSFNIISLKNSVMAVQYDIIVATLYSTLFYILNYFRTKKRLYLIQNYETDFYLPGDFFRSIAEKTYSSNFNIEYITISKWCEKWLWSKYRKKSKYAPNGIDLVQYFFHRRQLNKNKIRILIEGDSSSHYKNVDESFKIVEKLDKNKFEIWYLSYNGKPKDWYRVDKFLNEIPFEKVSQVYDKCDILLKSSWLESFSYPPLEMMATGGFSIVVPNGGNKEYLKDGENCLFYDLGNINSAIKCIERLISDEKLQQHLYENGLLTARNRDWKLFKKKIISLYDG